MCTYDTAVLATARYKVTSIIEEQDVKNVQTSRSSDTTLVSNELSSEQPSNVQNRSDSIADRTDDDDCDDKQATAQEISARQPRRSQRRSGIQSEGSSCSQSACETPEVFSQKTRSNVTIKSEDHEVIDIGDDDDEVDSQQHNQTPELFFDRLSTTNLYATPSDISYSQEQTYVENQWLTNDSSKENSLMLSHDLVRPRNRLLSGGLLRHCSYCSATFSSLVQMKMHVQRRHKRYSLPSSESSQVPMPTGLPIAVSEKLACNVCFLTFRSLDGLKCHINTKHSQNKHYRCKYCAQTFLTRQAAYTHRIKFHRLGPTRK